MSGRRVKTVAVFGAMVLGIALLAADGSRSDTVYYQTLPEYRAGKAASGPVRITGYVAAGTIVRDAGRPLRFTMTDAARKEVMAVSFDDVVPDTFKDGAEVVVEGGRGPDGTFAATTLLAKCPSKYESADGRPDGSPASTYGAKT